MTASSPPRIAAIDVGTNSVLLTIAERSADGRIITLCERAQITRIGEGLGRGAQFLATAMDRTAAVLAEYAAECRTHHVTHIIAVGTAAFRKAQNAREFCARVEQESGFHIDIISGEREAALSFAAAAHDFGDDALVLDIGGGSTEFIWRDRGVLHATSIPVGSVVLEEQYVHSDPINTADYTALQSAIDAALAALPDQLPIADPQNTTRRLVGLAGSVTTLAAMHLQLAQYSHDQVHGTILTIASIRAIHDRLRTATLADRKTMRGLEPKRADVILNGAMLILAVMDRTHFTELTVSDRGVRWGLLYEALAEAK